jgi:two-component system chemotaxis sensor kinase CheA
MMLHDLSEGVVVASHQPTVPSFLHAEQKQEVQEGAHRYKIELPDIPQRDVNALVDELGLLGRVSVTPLAKAAAAP